MTPLRILAIASNVVFMIYAYWQELTPILVLHAILLVVNTYRLMQLVQPSVGGDRTLHR